MAKTKLKRCPFCGGKAKANKPSLTVQCKNCNASMFHPIQEEAIKAWNTRVHSCKNDNLFGTKGTGDTLIN